MRGPELFPTYDFAAAAKIGDVTASTANSFTTGATGGGPAYAGLMTVGTTYEIVMAGTTTATSLSVRNTNGTLGAVSISGGAFSAHARTVWQENGTLWLQNVDGGTTTVTSLSVRAIPGNTLIQPTSGSRPILSARVNLLTATDDFTNGVWLGNNVCTPDAGTAPDGSQTAAKVAQALPAAGSVYQSIYQQISVFPGTHKRRIWAEAAGVDWVHLQQFDGVTNVGAFFNLAAGTIGTVTGGMTASMTPAGAGYWLTLESATDPAATFERLQVSLCRFNDDFAPVYTGDGVSGVYLWHPDLRTGADADLNIPPYQYVNTDTDYDSAGFPDAWQYDGADDGLSTVAFSAGTMTSDMDCFVAVRRYTLAQVVLAYQTSGIGTEFFFNIQDGDVTRPDAGCGTPAYVVNGAGVASTRDALSDAMPVEEWAIVEAHNLDLSAWTALGWGGFAAAYLEGDIGGIILCPAQTDGSRAQIRRYLGNKVGLSL